MRAWGNGGDLRSLTKTTETTCLFCDLRGFTRFSEILEDDDAQRVLNRYLTEMSESICAYNGTIVGYRGDGIVALFGAPEAHEDHADNAVRAAREMTGPRLEATEPLDRRVGPRRGVRHGRRHQQRDLALGHHRLRRAARVHGGRATPRTSPRGSSRRPRTTPSRC